MQERTLNQLARLLGGTVSGDGNLVITGLAVLDEAGPGDLTFVAKRSYLDRLRGSGAGAVILCEGMPADRPAIIVADAYAAFARLLAERLPDPDRSFPPGVHPTAVVAAGADVGRARSIGPYCVVGPGAVLGRDCRLGPHVILGADVRLGAGCVLHGQTTLREGCILGDRVVVHPGCVIGSDGFGYLPGPAGMVKIPQVGIVQIEDDVEIGAGVTIDRATVGRTRIGAGSKIDNQVQIGHNVTIGRHCALSALTGIAGSSTLEDGVVVGGQVGIGDHLRIGAGTMIGGKSGVWRDVPPGAALFGYPALDIKETFRITGAMRQLPDLIKRFRRLENRIQASSEKE